MFIAEFTHYDFRKFQQYETSVHEFLLDDFLRLELDRDQIFIYYGEIFTSGLDQTEPFSFFLRY